MNYTKLLDKANNAMLVTLLSFLICTIAAYGFESHLPLMLLVVLHISQILCATAFKFSYVLRLVAQNGLGLPLR